MLNRDSSEDWFYLRAKRYKSHNKRSGTVRREPKNTCAAPRMAHRRARHYKTLKGSTTTLRRHSQPVDALNMPRSLLRLVPSW
eukprot:395259-Pyramimonas_sp.AAC.1